MRTLLTIACLAAVSQAVRTNAAQACCNHSSGSSNPKCNPCDPSFERFDADTDHKKKDEIDVTKDFLKDFAEIGDEFIHQSKVDGILRAALNLDIADDITENILKPILDAKVGSMIPVKKIAEMIASLNKEDETIKVEDDLPSVDAVVEKEIEEAEQKDEGVEFHAGITSDPKDWDFATVEELDTPDGEVLMITIPHNFDGKDVEEVPVDEIGDLADEVAEDMIDDIAKGETPAVESKSESESEAEVEVEVEAKAEAEVDAEVEVEAEAEAEVEAEAESEAEPVAPIAEAPTKEVVVDEGVVDEGVVDEKVVEEKVVDEKVVDEKVVDEGVVEEGVVDEAPIVLAPELPVELA